MDDALAVRFFLRPFGSPLTIALSGLAIASVVQSGIDLAAVLGAPAGQIDGVSSATGVRQTT
jgi:hypothetical protein